MQDNTGETRISLLISNDDGVHAPGILALKRALAPLGDVVVIAPERNWSASGHTKTLHKPLRVDNVRLGDGSPAMATSGSPSDCVALAVLGLLERKPDLVLSGVNIGANVGHDLTYSGTVAVAMEAVIWGIPAIAVSLDGDGNEGLDHAARFAARLAARLLEADEPTPLLLNVNVPGRSEEEIRGVRITRLGRRVYRDALVERRDPRGRPYYWIGGDPPVGEPEEGTDIGALGEGYISVTPVRLDLTDHDAMPTLQSWRLGSEGRLS